MQTLEYGQNALISFPVSNLNKAIDWYVKILGFEQRRLLNDPPWCELSTTVDGLSIGLAEVTKVRIGDTMLTLSVASVADARRTLKERGADVSDIIEIDDIAKVVTLLDIDGNAIMLREGEF